MRRIAWSLIIALVSACGSGGADPDPVAPPTAVVTKVTITPEISSMKLDSSVQLTVRAFDAQDREIQYAPSRLQWTNYSPVGISFLYLTDNGLLTARYLGTASVGARIDGVEKRLVVTITP